MPLYRTIAARKAKVTAYAYPKTLYRAQCRQIVDNCTLVLLVDLGFHTFKTITVRLNGIDPLQADPNPTERARVAEARDWLVDLVKATTLEDVVALSYWPLRFQAERRDALWWYGTVCVYDPLDPDHEVNINQRLVDLGLARALAQTIP